jgi:hypothetical protein
MMAHHACWTLLQERCAVDVSHTPQSLCQDTTTGNTI